MAEHEWQKIIVDRMDEGKRRAEESGGKMNKRIKIAVVGCGGIAKEAHLGSLQVIPGAELVALADPDEAALAAAGEAWNVPPERRFSGVDKVVASGLAEAAVVCTPAATHAAVAEACFEGGLHVFVEKPLATDVTDGEAMVAAAKAAGKQLAVGHYLRFMPHHRRIRDWVRDGKLGKVFSATAHEETLGIKPEEGIITDLAPHYIDLMNFYFAPREATRVRAWTGRANARGDGDRETEAEITIEYGDDLSARVEVYWTPGFGNWDACERRIRVVGSQGWIRTGMTSSETEAYRSGSLLSRMRGPYRVVPKFVMHPDMPIKGTAFRKELEAFLEAVRTGRPAAEINGTEALKTVKIVAAALKSAELGGAGVEP